MRTTLNLPDDVVAAAKRRAIDEGKTLTRLIIEGLEARLERSVPVGPLPVSRKGGGLRPGVTWERLEPPDDRDEVYR